MSAAMMNGLEYDSDKIEDFMRLGGKSFTVRMIDLFFVSASAQVQNAETGTARGDGEAVARAVHSLRSSAGNFGAAGIVDLTRRIEAAAIESRIEEIDPLVAELRERFDRMCRNLETVKDGLRP